LPPPPRPAQSGQADGKVRAGSTVIPEQLDFGAGNRVRILVRIAAPSRLSLLTPRAALEERKSERAPARHFLIQVVDLERDVVEALAVLLHVIDIDSRAFEWVYPLVDDATVALPPQIGIEVRRPVVIAQVP